MAEKKSDNKISGWDITAWESQYPRPKDLVKVLQHYCSRWVFQVEKCPTTEKIHYQCRIEVNDRLRPTAKTFPFKGNWTPTVKKQFKAKDDFYVMKEETRVAGPYRNDTYQPMTRQLENFLKFEHRPYQKVIETIGNEPSDRYIDLFIALHGNEGKSMFAEYLEYIGMAEEVPPFRNMEDIFQWVMCRPKKKLYIIDLPRGMKQDKLGELYAGIEIIKNGVAFDKRYAAKKERFDRPRVIVFTNTCPALSLMSTDRWRVHFINKRYEDCLVPQAAYPQLDWEVDRYKKLIWEDEQKAKEKAEPFDLWQFLE